MKKVGRPPKPEHEKHKALTGVNISPKARLHLDRIMKKYEPKTTSVIVDAALIYLGEQEERYGLGVRWMPDVKTDQYEKLLEVTAKKFGEIIDEKLRAGPTYESRKLKQ